MKTAEARPAAKQSQKSESPFFGKERNVLRSGVRDGGREAPVQLKREAFFNPGRSRVQRKITIGQPNDKYEREADATADKVVQRLRTNNPDVVTERSAAPVTGGPATPVISPLLQAKCAGCEQ